MNKDKELFEKFKKYAKDKYDYDVVNVPKDKVITFEKLFGGSFIKYKNKEGSEIENMESLLKEIQKTYDNLKSGYQERSEVIDEINDMIYSEDFSDTVKINYIKNLLKNYIKPF